MRNQTLVVVLLVLSGIMWGLFAMLFPGRHALMEPSMRWTIVGLLLLDALFYFVAAWGLARRIRFIHRFALLLVGGNALLSIADQVGLADLVIGLLNVVMLVLLIITYRNKKLVSVR